MAFDLNIGVGSERLFVRAAFAPGSPTFFIDALVEQAEYFFTGGGRLLRARLCPLCARAGLAGTCSCGTAETSEQSQLAGA